MNITLVVLLTLIIIELGANIYFLTNKKPKNVEVKRSIDVNVCNLLMQDKIVDKINNVIDSMIKDQAEVYQLMVLSTNELLAQYINSEEQDKMQHYLIYVVKKHISPEVKDLLSLVYNINTDKDLEDLISLRVKLYLINFVVEYNKSIEE